MTASPTLTRMFAVASAAIACLCLAVLYGAALTARPVAMDYEEAALLAQAGRLLPLDGDTARLLRVVPFGLTIAWLVLVRELLKKLGASQPARWMILAITAGSPVTIYAASHFLRAPLFAVIATACLVAVIGGRAAVAGILSGLACVVHPAGVALTFACAFIFLGGRQIRSAAVFAGIAMVLLAPSAGWRLAHAASGISASDRALVWGMNWVSIGEAVPWLIGLPGNYYWASVLLLLLAFTLWGRWRMLPDLFVLFYVAALPFRIWPPKMDLLAIVPLLAWMFWRGLRAVHKPEIQVAAATLVLAVEMVAGGIAAWHRNDRWADMERIFASIRKNTSTNAVVLADHDVAVALHTGRRVTPGYRRDPQHLFYDTHVPLVTPDQLRKSMIRSNPALVALTPADEGSYRRSVEALERGGVLEAVELPGAAPGYRVLRPSGR